MIPTDETNIQTVDRDGGSADITTEELTDFKHEVQDAVKDTFRNIQTRRDSSERVRLCVWEGQSTDGRKRKAALGRNAPAFEGEPDGRIRIADMVINEKKMVICLAAMRALAAVRVTSMQTHDPARGARLTTLLRWVLKCKIGRKNLRRVLEQWAEYRQGDAPALGILGVWWERESALEEKTMSLDEIQLLMLQHFRVPPAAAKAAMTLIADPAQEAAATDFIFELLADVPVDRARAKDIVSQLRTDGACTFPNPYWRVNGPCWYAYRLFFDIFCPTNTPADAQKARWWVVRESLSEVDLRERINSREYTEDFVEELLEKGEGQTILNFMPRTGVAGDGSQSVKWSGSEPDPYKGTYETLTIYYRAVNAANVPGVYYFPFSLACESVGHERKLLDYDLNARSVYPFVDSRKETLNNNLLDSRGDAELLMTDQLAIKDLDDSQHGNAMLSAYPPWETPANRPALQLDMRPFGKNKVNRRGESGPMEVGKYPVGITEMKAHIMRRIAEYHGRLTEDEGVHPMLSQIHNQWNSDKFSDDVMEACALTLSLCQQYMSDAEVEAVCDMKNGQPVPIARTREEIQGEFGLEMEYDVRNMDIDFVKAMAEVIGQVLLFDTDHAANHQMIVNWLMSALNPNLAEMAVRPIESANANEQKDERNNIAQVAAGLEPDMAEQGQNFGLRLQTWQQALQANPRLMDQWSPLARQIAEARMKHLHDQYEQFNVNPQIGRTLGKKVTGPQ